MQLLIPEIPSFTNFCHFRVGWERVWALSVFLSQNIRGEDGTDKFRLLLLSPFFYVSGRTASTSQLRPPLFLKPVLSCLVITGKTNRHTPSTLGDILLQAFLQLSSKNRLIRKQIKYWLISFYFKWTQRKCLSFDQLKFWGFPPSVFPPAFLFVFLVSIGLLISQISKSNIF